MFKGTSNPVDVEAWITQIKKVFCVITCRDDQKVPFVTFMLDGDTDLWWQTTQRVLTMVGQNSILWEAFLMVFCEKYFLENVHENKEV